MTRNADFPRHYATIFLGGALRRSRKRITLVVSRRVEKPAPRFLVFDAHLQLWGESAGAVRWLKSTKAETELAGALLRFKRKRLESAAVALELGEVRFTRIGARHSVRFLVELPLERVRTVSERLLSKTQIQVARRAAQGATLQEIARAIGRSPDTVRSHLREVYRRLEVSNRLELARALADPEMSRV